MLIDKSTERMGILARWYANPLTAEEARTLLNLSRSHEQAKLKRFATPYLSPFLKLIALYWLGDDCKSFYRHMVSKTSASTHVEILKPLIYGQLLMSQRRQGATDYLEEAFHQSRLLLRPEDYFTLMKRHQLLRKIPLSKASTNQESLQQLLTTAAVIMRMSMGQKTRQEFTHNPDDTYG